MTYSILFSSHRLLSVLYLVTAAALALAVFFPQLFGPSGRSIEHWLRGIATSKRASVLTAALFPMVVRLAMLPWYPPPPPQIHDEFSYLLQADTFAHGRVTNPTPPYWEHFETEYTLLRPTYASQYQPAQGLVLAVGEVIFRNPWWGVWLSIGVMCGVLCWALREIVPPVWALAGGLGAGLQFGIFGLWMNSYFGGAVAATAGALIVAGLARIKRGYRYRSSAMLCAFGIILTFATRPFEALLWSAIAAGFAFFYLPSRDFGIRHFFLHVVAPFMAVFVCGAMLLAWYNWRVTGSPAQPPYLAYQRVYGTPQPYWWQPRLTVTHFDFPEIRDNYLNQYQLYMERYSLPAMFKAERNRLANFWRFFVGPFFTPALVFLPLIFRDRRIRPWLWACVPFVVAKATYHAWYPQHSAPETILIVLVLLECWRHLRAFSRRKELGIAMSRALTAAACLTIVLATAGRASEPFLLRHNLAHLPPLWESMYPAKRLRDDVTAALDKVPGRHLVFVKYSPGHCFCEEWVFNLAELSEQRIIYARTYNFASDVALAQKFPDFDVWMMEPDKPPHKPVRLQDELQWAALSSPSREHSLVTAFAH